MIEVLAENIGTDSINAVAISAEVVLQRSQESPLQEGQGRFVKVLEEAKAEYNSLAAAYTKKDWKAVEVYGDSLSDLFRDELLLAFDVESHREQLKARRRLNQQTEYDLMKWERRKKEIETFFGDETDMEDLHSLIYEIEDLSDEVHDCARDGQFDGISICFPELKKRWKLLLGYVNQE